MDWKIRNIRLQELREIYQEKLKNIAYRVYESHFQNGIVKQEELEGEIMSYYQHTQPSLQEFYSHYATQWEHFYEGHELTDSAFLRFLENSAYPLQMKYNRGDLNLQYYIDRSTSARASVSVPRAGARSTSSPIRSTFRCWCRCGCSIPCGSTPVRSSR